MNQRELIENFYTAFQRKDWQGMQACYHDDVVFSDPVFQHLKGTQAKAMWHMLLVAGKDLTITFRDVRATESEGSCHWEAHYTFSRTGRKVHNVIEARFRFREGKIGEHTDRFDLWKWARMALGMSGLWLGWSPFLQKKVRDIAKSGLEKFIREHPFYAQKG